MRPHLPALVVALLLATACGAGAPAASRAVADPHPKAGVQPLAARAGREAPGAEPSVRLPAAVTQFRSVREHRPVAVPTAIRIPVIGVDSTLQRLGRNPDGSVQVPREWGRAGWYAGGARPGQPGPAVVLGHVDSRSGPAVFFRLHELRPGDAVIVERRDGSVARFRVDRVERHPKDRFPTDEVYFPTLEPTLRLVTCAGAFDRSVGHYRDNLIAFATLEGTGG